jgi:hypothetical protein
MMDVRNGPGFDGVDRSGVDIPEPEAVRPHVHHLAFETRDIGCTSDGRERVDRGGGQGGESEA